MFNRGWFSAPAFVRESVCDHVIIFIVVGDLSCLSLYSVWFVTIPVSSADHVRANSTLKLRLDFRRSLVSGLPSPSIRGRSAGSIPEQRLVIERNQRLVSAYNGRTHRKLVTRLYIIILRGDYFTWLCRKNPVKYIKKQMLF